MSKRNRSRGTGLPLMPRSEETEAGIIGAILLDPRHVPGVMSRIFPSYFYNSTHRLIFEAMKELHDNSMPVEYVSVKENLISKGHDIPDTVFAEYTTNSHWAADVQYYCSLLTEYYVKRHNLNVCQKTMDRIQDRDGTAGELLDYQQQEINILSGELIKKSDIIQLSDLCNDMLDDLEAQKDDKGKAIKSGYTQLDSVIYGFEPGENIIVAAATSMGKTSLACNLINNISKAGHKSGMIILESTAMKIMRRLACLETETDGSALRNFSALGEEKRTRFRSDMSPAVGRNNIVLSAPGNRDIMSIAALAIEMKTKHNIEILFIDYLGLIQHKAENRNVQVTEVSAAIKGLAVKLSIPIVLLSQLNRELYRRDNNEPRLSDLRDSGSIEQDADKIIFIHRPNYFLPVNERQYDTLGIWEDVNLIIAKNRDGRLAKIDMQFAERFGLFA